jgi:ATP synthase protein I
MSKETEHWRAEKRSILCRMVGSKATRKLKARRNSSTSDIWFGLGLIGVIGWSVAIPTLLCTALGIWIDSNHPGKHTWTLMLLVIGLAIGCFNAWHWVAKEGKEIRDDKEDKDE